MKVIKVDIRTKAILYYLNIVPIYSNLIQHWKQSNSTLIILVFSCPIINMIKTRNLTTIATNTKLDLQFVYFHYL